MLSNYLRRDASGYLSQQTNNDIVSNLNPVLNLKSISSSTWVDSSNQNNNFTLTNSPSVSGNVITFNGSNQYAIRSLFNNALSTNVTLLMWIKTTSNTDLLFSMGRSASNVANEGIFQIVPTGQINFWDYNGFNFGFSSSTNSTSTVNNGVWRLVGFVKNGLNMTYYIDGIASGTNSSSINITYNLTSFAIGADVRDGINYFNGQMRQVMMYNKSLTATNILDIYNATK